LRAENQAEGINDGESTPEWGKSLKQGVLLLTPHDLTDKFRGIR